MGSRTNETSMWTVLTSPVYAVLFCATVLSNIGTWMHEVGASWLMTELSADPTKIAMIQTAVALPIFLFALPAGALADLVDRRKLLVVVNLLACFIAIGLGAVIHVGIISPWILISFTFALGISAAFIAPAWQAIVPNLVDRSQLSEAVALNGVGINISRAIGPAIAGVLIVSFGIQAPFWLNAVSYLFIICALLWWSPPNQKKHGLPTEHAVPAIVSGLRYARHSIPLRNTLVRAVAFFLAASVFWALLPLIVSHQMKADASLYGTATALIGVGALFGAFLMPRLKVYMEPSSMLLVATIIDAGIFVVLALTFTTTSLLVSCFTFGASWIIALANLNVSAQTSLPNWVRARGLSIFLMVFFGAMSLGSIIWGNVASALPLAQTLMIAGGILVIGALATIRNRLNLGDDRDLEPSLHWPTPKLANGLGEAPASLDQGPVMVTIEYYVNKQDWRDFKTSIQQLGVARKRYGAYQWGVFQDTANPNRFLEYFFESSWLHHLQHHEHTSEEDRQQQIIVNQFHEKSESPLVSHFLSASSDA